MRIGKSVISQIVSLILINLILANDSSEVLSKKANEPLGNSYDGNPATTNSRDS
jgi:hypothetical protein